MQNNRGKESCKITIYKYVFVPFALAVPAFPGETLRKMEAKILSAAIDPATIEALRLFTERITAQYDVLDLMLFGSRARGDHARDSDADVAVLLRGGHQRLLPTKLAMADEAFDVMLETGVRIQPRPIWEDEWADPEHYANPRLLRNIAREGVRL
jgi:predicted nucleotidyltransferase